MENRVEMTAETQQTLAGFLAFPEGVSVPRELPGFEKALGIKPKVFIKPYTVEGMKKRLDKTLPFIQRLEKLFKEGEGMVRWEDWPDVVGNDFPFSQDAISTAAKNEGFMAWVDAQVLLFTQGPAEEEKRALG